MFGGLVLVEVVLPKPGVKLCNTGTPWSDTINNQVNWLAEAEDLGKYK